MMPFALGGVVLGAEASVRWKHTPSLALRVAIEVDCRSDEVLAVAVGFSLDESCEVCGSGKASFDAGTWPPNRLGSRSGSSGNE